MKIVNSQVLLYKWMKISFLITSFILSTGCFIGALAQTEGTVSSDVERAALLAIYNSTGGENWTQQKRWALSRINSYPNPDSVLYGVTVENGDIVSIRLDQTGLIGTIPAELSNLTALQYLSVRSNTLSGALPDISALRKLKTLDFSYNNFSGSFPIWLGTLVDLESLDLSGNQLTGPLPAEISQLIKLRYLALNNTNLSAPESLPLSFSQLSSLQTLELQGSSLNPASITTGLSGLPNLQSLFMGRNTSFKLADGTFPDVLINLPNLRTLTLEAINFSRLPSSFKALSSLNYLSLSNSDYSDANTLATIFDTLKNVPSLRTLVLSSCGLTGLPSNIADLAQIENLFLSGNYLLPSQWDVIGSLSALKNLYVNSCNLSELPASLVNILSLQGLYASNNKLYPIPSHIQDIPNLRALDLSFNGIQGLPSWFGLGSMQGLNSLMLNNNQITLPLPDAFQNLTNLTFLRMSSNNLQETLPAYFSTFSKINQLDLSNNQLTSPLPDLSTWNDLRYVYLQHNNLSGAVPAYLSNTIVPKFWVDISFNRYDALTSYNSDFNLGLIVNNNRLDFSNILKVSRPLRIYQYIPQDTINLQTEPQEVKAYIGSSFTLMTPVDTTTQPPSTYQWFWIDANGNAVAVTQPSTDGHTVTLDNFSESQSGRYIVRITNSAVPGLVLVSGPITVSVSPCVTNALVNFTHKKYVCAIIFEPPKNTSQCQGVSFSWDFGDGATSTEKRPAHGFNNGTYTVSLTVRYQCGTACQADTTVQRQVTFDPTEESLMDTLIQVATNVKQKVLAASASTFSNIWPIQHRITELQNANSYLKGTQGVWRNEGVYVFNTPRSQTPVLDVGKDGIFDLEEFNWEQAELNAIPNWIKANTITQYSPYSYELENRDVLGIYAAALYDYGGHLPSANGVNMRFNEMAYTGFEFFDNQASGNWIFGTQQMADYELFDVDYGSKNMAVIKASLNQLKDVRVVDVTAKKLFIVGTRSISFGQTYSLTDDEIICKQVYSKYPEWSVVVLKDAPISNLSSNLSGLWTGKLKVKKDVLPVIVADIDNTIAHSGKSSLRVTEPKSFKQPLLHLDSGKTYMISAWVSINNPYVITPILAENLGIDVVIRNDQEAVINTFSFAPTGRIIEGWQQVKGTFTAPTSNVQLELKFKPGNSGTAWYDDLRFHPEKGNMKSYVYDLKDYRLRAILDEENFASFFYYDEEGNLYTTKKETEEGIKTLTENISFQVERGN